MKKFSVILMVLALFVRAKTIAQEWEHYIEYRVSDSVAMHQYCTNELSDGRIIVCSSLCYQSNIAGSNGLSSFYPPHTALVALSPDGEELARKDYFRPGYWGSSWFPYVLENEDGEVFLLASYSPDHNYAYFNYYKNYDNPPTNAILGLYKLNDNLEIEQSYEHSFHVDTIERRGNYMWNYDPCMMSGNIFIHSAIIDDGCIVGAYTKNVSGISPDNDSLFFFKMNFEGELLAHEGLWIDRRGQAWQEALRREHLIKTDYGYHYYFYTGPALFDPSFQYNHNKTNGTILYLDKDFNVLKMKCFQKPEGGTGNYFTNMCVFRSSHNTTYLASQDRAFYQQSKEDCCLFEYDDDIESPKETLTLLRKLRRRSRDWDFVALSRAVTASDDHSILFCYALNVGDFFNLDSWIVIERLDEDFNTISTVYYSDEGDGLGCRAEGISTTRDGGVLVTFDAHDINNPDDPYLFKSMVVKFPAEVFMGVDEAHDHGLKVAIAYPNPGKDVLNIQTGLQGAQVEVYDMAGRLMHSQEITESITTINTEDWPAGVYVWKVYANGREAENGKWVKE